MVKHFEKLRTPLRCLSKYESVHSQTTRFFAAGFRKFEGESLWQFWGKLMPSQRLAMDLVEPFDEWEEFALFASHYGLYVAHNSTEPISPRQDQMAAHRRRRDSCTSLDSSFSTRTASPIRYGAQVFSYRYCANPDGQGLTHHGSAYPPCREDALAIHGGIGAQRRLSSSFVYAPTHLKTASPMVLPDNVAARCCHSMNTMGNGCLVLIGGRASPSEAMKDCWMRTESGWERIHDMPKPRYRHRAAPITLPHNKYGMVVFGGKNNTTDVDTDTILWTPDEGWTRLSSLKQTPVPRFGMNFVTLGHNHGFMFGGMRQDGVICQGFWRWRLVIRDCLVTGISFRESTALDVSVGTYPYLARFGASYSIIRNEVLVTGGVGKLGVIPKSYEILSISGSLTALGDHQNEQELKVACVDPIPAVPGQPRPFLIGHSSHRTMTDQTLIIGGGATCFSFGSYWNRGKCLFNPPRQT